MENVRKYKDIKLVTMERRRNYRNEKAPEIYMNKPVNLGLSILELSKILMHKFWYDYVKPKFDEKAKPCYMDTDSFIVSLYT